MKLSGWGCFPVADTLVEHYKSDIQLQKLVLSANLIARGQGRAYGDSAIGASRTLKTSRLNKMISFDADGGCLVAEAGVTLEEIISTFMPRGWFPSVTPGTKYVTIGGMIAADVHGKNHHKEGSMFHFVKWVELMGPDGEIHRCSRSENSALFDNTVGGMGLTGIILRASIRLKKIESGWINQTTQSAENFREAIKIFEASEVNTYSVAWIDCLSQGSKLGRSLVMLGEHASAGQLKVKHKKDQYAQRQGRKLNIRWNAPKTLLNRFTVRAFNLLYYLCGSRNLSTRLVHWDSYFYPLDSILGWNKIYGSQGFIQFQAVLPLERSESGLESLLTAISDAQSGSFLAVLKRLGPGRDSGLSFPMEGYTLALDFPASNKNIALIKRLQSITGEFGGRIYLAKDALMSRNEIRSLDPRCNDFKQHRENHNAVNKFVSNQSKRLDL